MAFVCYATFPFPVLHFFLLFSLLECLIVKNDDVIKDTQKEASLPTDYLHYHLEHSKTP